MEKIRDLINRFKIWVRIKHLFTVGMAFKPCVFGDMGVLEIQ